MVKPEIQVWHSFEDAYNIEADVLSNNFLIEIKDNAKSLPKELQDRVDGVWNSACEKNPKMKDNPVLFLESLSVIEDGKFTANTNTRGFKHTFAFNRNADFQDLTDELRDYSLLTFSTHCHLVTKDNKILFGTKKN